MGTELGEFSENTFLYEAACNPDPVLRLTGVNRALEGLAIDVFNTMREFGDIAGDPVLEFCEDWMLADEVTHVKMGSDWLRRLTENDKERQERALEFQRVVDKLFSLGGFRGEEDDSPVRLARRFRELAGFEDDEMDALAEIAKRGPRGDGGPGRGQPRRGGRLGAPMPVEVRPDTFSMVFFDAAEIRAIVEKLVARDRPARRPRRSPSRSTRRRRWAAPRWRRSTRSCITAESGALEDAKAPAPARARTAPPTCSASSCSRVRDRLDPAFGDAARRRRPHPAAVGGVGGLLRRPPRPARATPVQRQRRLYQFRNRHGFTDAADAAFDRAVDGRRPHLGRHHVGLRRARWPPSPPSAPRAPAQSSPSGAPCCCLTWPGAVDACAAPLPVPFVSPGSRGSGVSRCAPTRRWASAGDSNSTPTATSGRTRCRRTPS